MKERILFIDIDGVLFGEYDGYYQLRPGVSSFFVWASQYFRMEFLTCWSWQRVQAFLEAVYIDRRSLKIGYRVWYNFKTDGIDPAREQFYIIDDNLLDQEVAQLEAWGRLDAYLKVERTGSMELERIKARIIALERLDHS